MESHYMYFHKIIFSTGQNPTCYQNDDTKFAPHPVCLIMMIINSTVQNPNLLSKWPWQICLFVIIISSTGQNLNLLSKWLCQICLRPCMLDYNEPKTFKLSLHLIHRSVSFTLSTQIPSIFPQKRGSSRSIPLQKRRPYVH